MEKHKVSVVILSKDKNELLFQLLDSFKTHNTYKNIEILIGDTGSESTTLDEIDVYIKKFDHCPIKVINYDYYNFAKNNNDIVKNYVDKESEYILFCNNDIEFINDAITEMVKKSEDMKERGKKIGTIGAILLYASGKVQHYGIKMYKKGFTHIGQHKTILDALKDYKKGEYIGNTFAFCLVPRETWDDVGGLNEVYQVCFEDVEFNLACLKKKYANAMSRAACFHYESQTRGRQTSREDVQRVVKYCQEMFNGEKNE